MCAPSRRMSNTSPLSRLNLGGVCSASQTRTPPITAGGGSAHPILRAPNDIAGWRRAFFTPQQNLH